MELTLNPRLTEDLIDRLEAIWVDVTNAGGSVGFDRPVTRQDVERGVAHVWDEVLDGTLDLVVAHEGTTVQGFGFLRASTTPVSRHRGEILKLQRDPAATGRGIGAAILAALEARAVDRGLQLLTLEVREGTGRERFYADHGWTEVARLPGWVRVGGADVGLIVMARTPGRDGGAPMTDIEPGEGLRMAVRRLDPDLPMPTYARTGDAGLDLYARERKVLPAGARVLMPTGIAVAIPDGHVGLVHPRSGLAVRQGLSIVNAPGTIDAGYRGELMVPLINLDPSATIRLERGDRIAQLLIQRVERPVLVEVEELPDGVRGTGGFGSTGR